MILQNHFNETVEIIFIRRLSSISGWIIKVRIDDTQTEYWDYDNFMSFNPEWEWIDG